MTEQATADLFSALQFHHIGVACRSIATEKSIWQGLGYQQEGQAFSDPLQGVNGLFMIGVGPRIELLEPLSGSETLAPFINSGIKMYHQAYETPNLENTIDQLKKTRAKVVSSPKPAVAFGGRCVSFLMLRNAVIIELIESFSSRSS